MPQFEFYRRRVDADYRKEAYGDPTAGAISSVGGAMGQWAEYADELQDKEDRAEAATALSKTLLEYGEMERKSKLKWGGRKDFAEKVGELGDDLFNKNSSGLKNQRAQEYFESASTAMKQRLAESRRKEGWTSHGTE